MIFGFSGSSCGFDGELCCGCGLRCLVSILGLEKIASPRTLGINYKDMIFGMKSIEFTRTESD